MSYQKVFDAVGQQIKEKENFLSIFERFFYDKSNSINEDLLQFLVLKL
jgi:hypothetical protein